MLNLLSAGARIVGLASIVNVPAFERLSRRSKRRTGAGDAGRLVWPVPMPRARASLLSFPVALGLLGCSHVDPPAPDASPSVALPEPPVAQASGSSAVASATSEPPVPEPDPASLPQTHDVPHAQGAAFDARCQSLWDAIVSDDPDRALPFFFPLGAYRQVKDVPNPAADWNHRLVAAYRRDIHALHARLGADAGDAKLLGFDVPEARARWVEPGEEWNKIGYYRVFGTKVRYLLGGQTQTFDVKSLISWRGEWFVVHLSAIG
jgi:hypothetical protein